MPKSSNPARALLALFLVLGCRTAGTAPRGPEERCGVFHIVWGDGPRYFLADEQGNDLTLVLDEALAHPFGGPRALDRTRVCLTGARDNATPSTLRVLTLSPTPAAP